MDILLFFFAGILMAIGLVGSIVPGIPGSPCSYLGLILLHLTDGVDYSTEFLIGTLAACIVVFLLDFYAPIWCTKRFGGSKKGVWGSIIGLFAGLFSPIPYGFIVGPFVGAVVGELLDGKDSAGAFRSGVGSFIGFLVSTGAKLALGIAFCWFFIEAAYSCLREANLPSPF